MKYIKTFLILLISLFGFSMCVNAQEVQTIIVDGETIEYTQTYNDLDDATSYYNEDILVLTEHDDDGNGKPDSWVLYRSDMTVRKDVQDSDGDGEIDIVFELDADENIVKSTGEGLKQYEVEESELSEEETSVTEDVDYAGDLTDIKKLAGEGGGWGMWIFVLLAGGGIYMWWKKKK